MFSNIVGGVGIAIIIALIILVIALDKEWRSTNHE